MAKNEDREEDEGILGVLKGLNPNNMFKGGSLLIVAILLLILLPNLFEVLDASRIMVIQNPMTGSLTWYTSAGPKWQGFGKVTKYTKRSQFWFSSKADQGSAENQAIQVRFNDNGHAGISGSMSWMMPMDIEHLTALHTSYGSQEAIEQQVIRTVVEKAVYMTGPLMSSKESAAERRTDLLSYIEDQVQRGVYKTVTETVTQPDPMTGEKRTVNVVKIVTNGNVLARNDESPLQLVAGTFYCLLFKNV